MSNPRPFAHYSDDELKAELASNALVSRGTQIRAEQHYRDQVFTVGSYARHIAQADNLPWAEAVDGASRTFLLLEARPELLLAIAAELIANPEF